MTIFEKNKGGKFYEIFAKQMFQKSPQNWLTQLLKEKNCFFTVDAISFVATFGTFFFVATFIFSKNLVLDTTLVHCSQRKLFFFFHS